MGNNNYTQDQDSGYLASTLRVYPAFLRQHLKYSPCLKRQLHPRCPVEEPLSMLLVSDPALELATLPTNSNGMSANVDISMITFECDDLSTYLPTLRTSPSSIRSSCRTMTRSLFLYISSREHHITADRASRNHVLHFCSFYHSLPSEYEHRRLTWSNAAMAVLSVATSQLLVLPKAACSHLLSTRAAVMPMMHTMRCTTSVSLVTIC